HRPRPRASPYTTLLRSEGLVAPVAGLLEVRGVVLLGEAQVADRHGHRLLGLDDRVREVAHELVEHLLRVLRAVDERVEVRPRQLDRKSTRLNSSHVKSS